MKTEMGSEIMQPPLSKQKWRQRVHEKLPSALCHPRIAIIGSVDFYHSDSQPFCDEIGKELAKRLPNACLLTGANAIVQERLSRAFFQETQAKGEVFHLAPSGYSCKWGFGICMEAGETMEQRRYILSTLADVCISIEGGPGTVDEMNKAQSEEKIVVPLARTGGASGGLFEAPALPCPSIVDTSVWDMLGDERASIQDSAIAAVDVVEAILKNRSRGRKNVIAKAITGALDMHHYKLPSLPDDTPAYVEPTLAGSAHLVFQGRKVVTSTGCAALGNIYLGPKSAADLTALADLQAAGIRGIVNCTNRVPCYHQEKSILYCTVAVNDEVQADILTHLDGATLFLHHLLTNGSNVLVHCEMGISRSATVVIAYLIRMVQMTRDEAYLHVKARRPKSNPNPGFWKQLKTFEEQRHKKCETGLPGVTGDFDLVWATQSNAVFATCRSIPEALQEIEPIQRLSQISSQEDREHVICVALDFIWGRGVLDIDIKWLSFVCEVLDNEQTGEPSSLAVRSVLRDTNSEFWDRWSGEIYEPEVTRVLQSIDESNTLL